MWKQNLQCTNKSPWKTEKYEMWKNNYWQMPWSLSIKDIKMYFMVSVALEKDIRYFKWKRVVTSSYKRYLFLKQTILHSFLWCSFAISKCVHHQLYVKEISERANDCFIYSLEMVQILTLRMHCNTMVAVQKDFFYVLLLGCPVVNFGPLPKGQPH